ncbi:MAG: RagB/SusD family nutrient uptake outer membrane protein, partial [Chitinophagaceae bacterium]
SEREATQVISDSRYSLLSDLNTVFLGNSREAIWQLQSINFGGGRNTWEGNVTVPSTPTANSLFRLDTITLIPSFEATDLRLANWTGYRKSATTGASHYFPYKYKVRFDAVNPVSEHTMVMRFAEQYLIRAEARIQQNKLTEGTSDLDSIRIRAGIGALPTGMGKEALLLEVEKQRRLELFAEWGHRWFDLKRTQRADVVLKTRPEKTGWQITDTLYPIPLDARSTNPNLTQNDGY